VFNYSEYVPKSLPDLSNLRLITSFRKLEKIFEELNTLPKTRRQWYQASLTANADTQKIQKVIKDMDEAFSTFEVRVH
jgi:hypothetical protein